jgi:hypothetical protein
VCRVIAIARDAGPEVQTNLTEAGVALLRAAAAAAEAWGQRGESAGLEHIDLDEPGPGWDE